MKVIFTFVTFLAIGGTAEISPFVSQDAKFKLIQERAEAYYQTLPKEIQEDAKLLTPELVQKYGYPCERHTVESLDGYILEMHRIPYGKDGPSENRPAVYLQHGLMMSSGDWVVTGPEKGFAYLLADAGYDVWLPNVRGTRYSRKHKKLDPKKNKKKFWDFSWHEIAVNDVPAMIDYVISQTKQEKIYYIGHSQGTTVFYIMCSEKPQYNDKIRVMFSLGPIAYMKHTFSPIIRISALFVTQLQFLGKLFGIYEFLPNNGLLAIVGDLLCDDGSVFQILCTNALFAVVGFNKDQMNATLLPAIMGHTPAGSSTKQIYHYGQEINSGKFRQWDYGILGNTLNYGRLSPPRYKVEIVKAPVYLYYSKNDWMSHAKDVDQLAGELPNVQDKILVSDEKFNHVDYCYAIDAPNILYNDIIAKMAKH